MPSRSSPFVKVNIAIAAQVLFAVSTIILKVIFMAMIAFNVVILIIFLLLLPIIYTISIMLRVKSSLMQIDIAISAQVYFTVFTIVLKLIFMAMIAFDVVILINLLLLLPIIYTVSIMPGISSFFMQIDIAINAQVLVALSAIVLKVIFVTIITFGILSVLLFYFIRGCIRESRPEV
jgi:hypothetical protein